MSYNCHNLTLNTETNLERIIATPEGWWDNATMESEKEKKNRRQTSCISWKKCRWEKEKLYTKKKLQQQEKISHTCTRGGTCTNRHNE